MFRVTSNREIVVSSDIIEWDIKSGNTSIMREYHLAPDELIDRLEKLDKKKRVIYIGKMMKKDKEFSKNLEKGFNTTVEKFLEENHLDIEYDVLDIRRDAVFVANRSIPISKIGNAQFVSKNQYHAFINLKPFVYYFSRNGNDKDAIEIKGMTIEEQVIHENGILDFFRDVVSLMESDITPKRTELTQYLVDFVNAYKNKELELDYYRVFSKGKLNGKFQVMLGRDTLGMDQIDETLLKRLDISYNYINVVLPMIGLINLY